MICILLSRKRNYNNSTSTFNIVVPQWIDNHVPLHSYGVKVLKLEDTCMIEVTPLFEIHQS
ncbi:MAG: hypothetical protein WBA16_04425 [Nonlabens sp.]